MKRPHLLLYNVKHLVYSHGFFIKLIRHLTTINSVKSEISFPIGVDKLKR